MDDVQPAAPPRRTRRRRPESRRLETCAETGASVFRPRRALDMHARSPAETGSGRAYGYSATRFPRLGPPAGERCQSRRNLLSDTIGRAMQKSVKSRLRMRAEPVGCAVMAKTSGDRASSPPV